MDIIFLGTGTGVPSARRGSPSLVLVQDRTTLLFDSGPGALRQLARAGLSFTRLSGLFYTHFHPDHVADLVAFLFAARYAPDFRPQTPILVFGPIGLEAHYAHLRAAYGHYVEPRSATIVFSELAPGDTAPLGPFHIETGPVPHTPPCLGYRVVVPGGPTVAITGDTDYGEDLVRLAGGADLLVTECSFPEGQKIDGHLTPGLAGRAAREAGVKALALVHFNPECDEADLLGPIAAEYDGPVTLAEDLDRITVLTV